MPRKNYTTSLYSGSDKKQVRAKKILQELDAIQVRIIEFNETINGLDRGQITEDLQLDEYKLLLEEVDLKLALVNYQRGKCPRDDIDYNILNEEYSELLELHQNLSEVILFDIKNFEFPDEGYKNSRKKHRGGNIIKKYKGLNNKVTKKRLYIRRKKYISRRRVNNKQTRKKLYIKKLEKN
jgi:hypothetical protein